MRRVCAVAACVLACDGAIGPAEEGRAPDPSLDRAPTSGALSSSCTGLMPAASELQRWSTVFAGDEESGECLQATSDGDGAFFAGVDLDFHQLPAYEVWSFDATGAPLGRQVPNWRADFGQPLLPLQSGYLDLTSAHDECNGAPCRDHVALQARAADGTLVHETVVVELTDSFPDQSWSLASDPAGAALLVHASRRASDGALTWYAQRYGATAQATTGARAVLSFAAQSGAPVALGGVALDGTALVLAALDGASVLFTGVWVDRAGNVLGPAGSARADGPLLAARLVPLLDGSLALQVNGKWIARYPVRSAQITAAPAWLATRPDTNVSLIRGARGYLVAFPNLSGSCENQHLAVFAPDGTRCGGFDLQAPGGCRGITGGSGRDGTVWTEGQYVTDQGEPMCQYNFWPGLLR